MDIDTLLARLSADRTLSTATTPATVDT